MTEKTLNALDRAKEIIRHESGTLNRLADSLDESFETIVDAIVECPGRVIVSGVGKSGFPGTAPGSGVRRSGQRSQERFPDIENPGHRYQERCPEIMMPGHAS